MTYRIEAFGSRVRQIREESEMTQEALALECGICQGHITQWERGKVNPSLESVVKVALGCEVSLDWLLGVGDLVGPERYHVDGKISVDNFRDHLAHALQTTTNHDSLAAMIDCEPARIVEWLDGERTPRLHFIVGIAETFGMTVSEMCQPISR